MGRTREQLINNRGRKEKTALGARGELRETFTAADLQKCFHLLLVREREESSSKDQF